MTLSSNFRKSKKSFKPCQDKKTKKKERWAENGDKNPPLPTRTSFLLIPKSWVPQNVSRGNNA